ncbi:hypothetical protein ACHQM5_015240 [Ranunculus cassubicifolius]
MVVVAELLCCEELQVVESNWRHKISRTRTESVGFPLKSFFQNLGEISAELHQRSSYYLSSQILTLYFSSIIVGRGNG